MRPDALALRSRAERLIVGLSALPAHAEPRAQSVLAGEHVRRKAGQGEKFWQYREYTVFDRPQDIDWRQSAKGDRVFVREKERQTVQTVLFWSAAHAGMRFHSARKLPTKAEAASVLSLALALLFVRTGERTGALQAPSRAGRGETALNALAEQLAGTLSPDQDEISSGGLPEDSLPLASGAHMILASDFLDEEEDITRTLARLAGQTASGFLLHVLDPAEMTLPFEGRAVFETPDHGFQEHIRHVSSVRAAYQARMETHLAFVRRTCRRYGWGYVLHVTDRDPRLTLADMCAALMLPRQEGFTSGGMQ